MTGSSPLVPTRFLIALTKHTRSALAAALPARIQNEFLLTAITADPETVSFADAAGIDRIGIDIERIGKVDRQRHVPGARISPHQLDELAAVTARVTRAEIFARLNPIHDGSRMEVEQALALGARVLMLPYFTHPREVSRFVEMIGGRAIPVLLLETAEAVARLPEIVNVPGVAEISVGLNDLHLSLGLSNIFDVVVSDVMDTIAKRVRGAGLRFGFGGVARFGDCTLPVGPDLIYAQYARLNATSAWLSRSFFAGLELREMAGEVEIVRRRLSYWAGQPPSIWESRRAELAVALEQLRIPAQ